MRDARLKKQHNRDEIELVNVVWPPLSIHGGQASEEINADISLSQAQTCKTRQDHGNVPYDSKVQLNIGAHLKIAFGSKFQGSDTA